MNVSSIDHVAIPIGNVPEMLAFYQQFGFKVDRTMAPRLYAVSLRDQKINFHDPTLWQNPRFTLRAPNARPGCGDFCFVWRGGENSLRETIRGANLAIEVGPTERIGGAGTGTSYYVRDPDENLVEFIVYLTE